MKVEEYGSLSDARRISGIDIPVRLEDFQPTDVDIESLIAGVERLEQRLGQVIGRAVSRGLWFGDKYIFYGADSAGSGFCYGVRKLLASRSSWVVLGHGGQREETVVANSTNRFEDAWKAALAAVINSVFSKTAKWSNARRAGVFFNCIPPQVDKIRLTEELAWEIFDPDTAINGGGVERRYIAAARQGDSVLWRSQIDPDAWIDSVSTTQNTPEAAWGFNLSAEDFVDLAFDWALSPVPLDGAALAEVN